MYDRERIAKMVSDTERYLKDLNELDIHTIEDLNDKKNLYALSMVLFSIINRTIDLADEIVISNSLGMPSSYRETFALLARDGYIDRTLMEKMSGLVFYRNLLAHEYYDVSEKDLLDLQANIGMVRQFLGIVKDIVKRDAMTR